MPLHSVPFDVESIVNVPLSSASNLFINLSNEFRLYGIGGGGVN
jgi:hypothetical protein